MTAEIQPLTIETRKARLRRLDRNFARTPIYYVTACAASRRDILRSPAVHESFLSFVRPGTNHGAWVGGYVLMPDHLHLFVGFDDRKIQISQCMKSLKNTLSKTLRLNGIASPHWQKGFFDHVLRSEESYEEKWNYVRENPVRAGLVPRSDEWPYLGEINDLRFT